MSEPEPNVLENVDPAKVADGLVSVVSLLLHQVRRFASDGVMRGRARAALAILQAEEYEASVEMVCRESGCRQRYHLTAHERRWFEARAMAVPTRCPNCRAARRAARDVEAERAGQVTR